MEFPCLTPISEESSADISDTTTSSSYPLRSTVSQTYLLDGVAREDAKALKNGMGEDEKDHEMKLLFMGKEEEVSQSERSAHGEERGMTLDSTARHPSSLPHKMTNGDGESARRFRLDYDVDETDTELEFEDDEEVFGHRNYSEFLKKLGKGVLDVHKLNLYEIPLSLFEYDPPITTIYMKDNYLSNMPEHFFESLPCLTWLDIRNNRLSYLPAVRKEHDCLQVILLQGNHIKSIPYSFGLFTNLKTIGITGNNILDPPNNIICQGTEAILDYCRKKFRSRAPLDFKMRDDYFESETRDSNQQLRLDLNKTLRKGTQPSWYDERNPKDVALNRKLQSTKYTWALWNRIPYYGRSNLELFRTALQDTQKKTLTKLKNQEDRIIQKYKSYEALNNWRDKARLLQRSQPNFDQSSYELKFPFDTMTPSNESIKTSSSVSLSPSEYRKELNNCWEKLRNFSQNPVSLSNSSLALQRINEVEDVKKKILNLRISSKTSFI